MSKITYQEPTLTDLGSFEEITNGDLFRSTLSVAAISTGLMLGAPSHAAVMPICKPGDPQGYTEQLDPATGKLIQYPVLCGAGGYPDVGDAWCINHPCYVDGKNVGFQAFS